MTIDAENKSSKDGCGILHLGLGAFHRAHQADFTHDAMALAGGNWGIEAVSMRNAALANSINQNNIFHLLIKQSGGTEFKPITAIKKASCLAGDPDHVAKRIADPDIHIITITVTEKGYGLDRASGGLNLSDPVVAHDLENPSSPRGLLGVLAEGLRQRKDLNGKGITIISCDNLSSNGKILKSLVLEFATQRDLELANWIEQYCTFPSSMVDRITPASTDETFKAVKKELGSFDPLAVETEPFRQWVIEDDFAGPRPQWEKAGVIIVPDVEPFEKMKLRMLNGAHSFIAYLGTFLELSAVRDVMADAQLVALIEKHMEMAGETNTAIDGFDLTDYKYALIRRFENKAIDHRCIQIAMDGSQKMPQRIFAPALSRLQTGKPIKSFALATALWMKHIIGNTVYGKPIELNDPLAEKLKSALIKYPEDITSQITAIGEIAEIESYGLFSNSHWQTVLGEALKVIGEAQTQPQTETRYLIEKLEFWVST